MSSRYNGVLPLDHRVERESEPNLGFRIVKRAGIDVLVYDAQGCRPATDGEVAMWTLMFGEPEED